MIEKFIFWKAMFFYQLILAAIKIVTYLPYLFTVELYLTKVFKSLLVAEAKKFNLMFKLFCSLLEYKFF